MIEARVRRWQPIRVRTGARDYGWLAQIHDPLDVPKALCAAALLAVIMAPGIFGTYQVGRWFAVQRGLLGDDDEDAKGKEGQYVLGANIAIAVAVNFSTFLVIGKCDAVTYQVLGHLKTVLVLAFGVFALGDDVNARNALGVAVALVGMVAYGAAESAEKRRRSAAALSAAGAGGGGEEALKASLLPTTTKG